MAECGVHPRPVECRASQDRWKYCNTHLARLLLLTTGEDALEGEIELGVCVSCYFAHTLVAKYNSLSEARGL